MDLLEASAQLERIELLAKIAHVSESDQREKTIALTWIGEIAGEMRSDLRKDLTKQGLGLSNIRWEM
ncbi:hypothetical protein [Citrobacter amalonaticus]|uniref:hypothetical protein n=1 Tax=Citrobacter amalonaticus TaxID=35703 RepID=UPI0005C8FCC7|nr:hypothetical protein [Citrobacter amalonaticus]